MPDQYEKFFATLRFLTTFPAPESENHIPPQLNMMPLVGLIIGLILYLSSQIFFSLNPLLSALLILLVWFACTGFLHLDGLADLSDGIAASHGDKTRLLEVMKEPHIGSFAVIILILLILSKFVLLSTLSHASSWAALLLIPAWSRLGAAWWAQELPALSEGLATWCKEAGEAKLMPWFITLLLLSLIIQPVLLLAPVVLWLWKYFLEQKLGGMNGDCLGAGIEVCEAALLILCCMTL